MFRNNFYPRTLQESATVIKTIGNVGRVIFQSTHPTRECDADEVKAQLSNILFQSTHPTRECDVGPATLGTRITYFNPRTLQESATRPFGKGLTDKWHFNPRTLQESAT